MKQGQTRGALHNRSVLYVIAHYSMKQIPTIYIYNIYIIYICIERYWKILKYIERYWKILKDIERYWKAENCTELHGAVTQSQGPSIGLHTWSPDFWSPKGWIPLLFVAPSLTFPKRKQAESLSLRPFFQLWVVTLLVVLLALLQHAKNDLSTSMSPISSKTCALKKC